MVFAGTVLAAALLGGGCASDGAGSAAVTCRVPASLAACDHGPAWADCGIGAGAGEVLGCTQVLDASADCRWFAGGCMPAAYDPSPCLSSNVCCAADGHAYLPTDTRMHWGVSGFTSVFGRAPWDAGREREVDVTVGSLASVRRPIVQCTGAAQPFVCSGQLLEPVRELAHTVPNVSVQEMGSGQRVTVELFGLGVATARVCVLAAPVSILSDQCVFGSRPNCATSGTLTLSQYPNFAAEVDALALDGEVMLADGTLMELHL